MVKCWSLKSGITFKAANNLSTSPRGKLDLRVAQQSQLWESRRSEHYLKQIRCLSRNIFCAEAGLEHPSVQGISRVFRVEALTGLVNQRIPRSTRRVGNALWLSFQLSTYANKDFAVGGVRGWPGACFDFITLTILSEWEKLFFEGIDIS